MKMFSYDSPFSTFLRRLADLILLNLAFILTSLPVITVGMSLTALYRICFRLRDDRCTHPLKEYFAACREEWKKSTVVWLILALIGVILYMDLSYAAGMGRVLFVLSMIGFIFWLLEFGYVFPILARFENTIGADMINALAIAFGDLRIAFCVAFLLLPPFLVLVWGSAGALIIAGAVYLLLGFALTAYMITVLVSPVFAKYEPEKADETDTENTADDGDR